MARRRPGSLELTAPATVSPGRRATTVEPFQRDRLTWLAYLMLGFVGYVVNGIGPALAGLRSDLDIGYAVASLHSSLFAIGIVLAGIVGERVAATLGRRRAFWLAAAATAGAAWVLALARSLALTLPAALVMGCLLGLLILLVPAVLSDRHGRRRSTAFAESNAVSSAFGGVAPLLIGAAILAGLGWGPGYALPATVFLVVIAATLGTTRFPVGATAGDLPTDDGPEPGLVAPDDPAAGLGARPGTRPRGRLGAEFWRHWLTLVLVVAIEFCMIYWAAGYLQGEVGMSPAAAAASVAVFLGGMVVGRVAGGRLALRVAPDRLLVRALGLAAAGFVVFWATGLPGPSVVGLAITGLGVAMLYPLALAMAVGVAADAPDLASARCALGSGLAITVAPLVLGWSADQLGIRLAYLLVPVLIGLAFTTVRYAHR